MPPRRQSFSAAEIAQIIAQGVAGALAAHQALQNNGNGGGGGGGQDPHPPPAKPCTYKDFLNCKPLNFSGTEGAIGLLRWIEKMESVFMICNCPENYKVKFSSCTFLEGVLTWWNTYTQTVGNDVAYQLPWENLKEMLKEEYCPREEIQQLEVEFWNLTVKGNDIASYTLRFHQLALLCPTMVYPEGKRIERYIWGLPEEIQGMVTASKPGTIQSAVRMAHNLMAQVVRRGTPTDTNTETNKRKWDGNSNNNPGQQLTKKSDTTTVYATGSGEKRYKGSKPLCSKCDTHHEGPCGIPCDRCKSYGHQTKDCRVKICFECGKAGHFRNDCPQANNNA